MKRYILVISTMLILLSPLLLGAQTKSPTAVIEEVYKLLSRYSDTSPTKENDRKIINGHFLLQKMAYDAIADHWKIMNPKQQQIYNQLMQQLLLKTIYEDTGDKLSKGKFTINSSKNISSTRTIVLTTVTVMRNNLRVANDYILNKQTDGKYKVRDILIDNANVALDYKSQFNQIVPEYGIEKGQNSLFARMRRALIKKENWNEVGDTAISKENTKEIRKKRPTLLER